MSQSLPSASVEIDSKVTNPSYYKCSRIITFIAGRRRVEIGCSIQFDQRFLATADRICSPAEAVAIPPIPPIAGRRTN